MSPPTSVLVIGCGLIGTSIALALREHGVDVHLDDVNRSNLELAVSRLGSGAHGVDDSLGHNCPHHVDETSHRTVRSTRRVTFRGAVSSNC